MNCGLPALCVSTVLATACLIGASVAEEAALERPAQNPLSKPAAQTSAAPQTVLKVNADGSLVLAAKPVAFADLPARLIELAKIHKDYSVVLQGDERVPYKEVVRVLDACRDAGIWNVSFAVTKTQ